MPISEREALRTELAHLRWALLNEKSAPALLKLLRESADAMGKAMHLLDRPLENETDHLMAIALLFESVRRTTVDSHRENYVDDSKAFDEAITLFRRLYNIED